MRFKSLSSLSVQIILRHHHIRLARTGARPGHQPHVGLARVGSGGDDFRRRLPERCLVHLVLHRGEEELRRPGPRIVVRARGVNIQHLAPERFLRRPDVADALQQFVKVSPATRLLQPLVIHREALHDVFPQPLRGSDAELRAALGFHAVADGDDDIQIVVLRGVDLAIGGSG